MAKKTVLVVDDDPAILVAIEKVLRHPDLSVTTARNTLEAYNQARQLKPLLIISDIMMPTYGDGGSIIKHLREDPTMPTMPIVFMTGLALPEAFKLIPANDPTISVLSKPIDLNTLRDHVWKLAGIVPPEPQRP
jgi:CheY-like chemotaxis protein